MMSEILISFLLLLNLFVIIISIRNNVVHEYRIRMINEIYRDPHSFLLQHKIAEFKSVSYHKMMLKFWRPVDSFYPTLGKEEK